MNNKQLRIISDDILNGHFLGYNQIFDRFANLHSNSYPPHNIVATGEDTRDIEFAIAGFLPEEVDVTVENAVLTVAAGQQITDEPVPDNKEYIHHGISKRGFIKQFSLAEYWVVEKARFEHGILTISVKQEIPEAKKPKIIKIEHKS